MSKSKLTLIPAEKRKKTLGNSRKLSKSQIIEDMNMTDDQSSVLLLFDDNILGADNYNVIFDVNLDDDEKEAYISPKEYYVNDHMDQMIQNMMSQLAVPNTGNVTFNTGNKQNNVDLTGSGEYLSGDTYDIDNAGNGTSDMPWDPRLIRIDGFRGGGAIVPFASHTAASAYYDMVFAIEAGIVDQCPNDKYTGADVMSGQNETYHEQTRAASYKIAPNKEDVNMLKSDPNMYGTQSLINPYCVTRLVGGLTKIGGGDNAQFQTHMCDIRDRKRFYDNVSDFTMNSGAKGLVNDATDFTSINNPTTDNIISWSNKDKWGRTPYSFQDFVFCKWWNIIPNNRLITFRKYAVPTYDNLNFPNMLNKDGTEANNYYAAPIATVVSYFGGETPNKLNDLLKFTTGTKWKTLEAEVHKVGGNEGSNPRALVDSMFEGKGGFGGQGSASNIVNAFLNKTGGITADYISFGKFVGLLDSDGYYNHSMPAWEKLTAAQMDPRETIYANRIVGPVNRIQSVQAREAGLEFSQTFTLTCEYIARPIAGINTKAAILDILANCLEIASADAVFWGGGYHYQVKPHLYPFKGTDSRNTFLEDLYAGNIFGTEGAIAHGLKGVLDFGSSNKAGTTTSFEWSNITSKLGDVLSKTVGAIGNMLQSISSSIFGESSSLTNFLKKTTDMAATEDQQKAGVSALNNMFTNLNKMWKDRVIQESMAPNINGIRSILSGEPTGNWHLTIGNPLNPILVCGNLICKKMDVNFTEELGPDDFPLGLNVTYSIEHAMARDKGGIQSMFNRGAGKIYKLPDYVRASSDYESTVDRYTGDNNVDLTGRGSWVTPYMMNANDIMSEAGIGAYNTFKIETGKDLSNLGNPDTTKLTFFRPLDREAAYQVIGNNGINVSEFKSTVRSAFFANTFTRKYNNG